jgi:hypothetical protein
VVDDGSALKDLVVWQKAMDMVTEIYKLTDNFPKQEVYSLTNQIRRAAVSVPSNIAEGQAHYSHREFRHFLRHSAGSPPSLRHNSCWRAPGIFRPSIDGGFAAKSP